MQHARLLIYVLCVYADVLNNVLDTFLSLVEVLASQLGQAFAQQAITSFLQVFRG